MQWSEFRGPRDGNPNGTGRWTGRGLLGLGRLCRLPRGQTRSAPCQSAPLSDRLNLSGSPKIPGTAVAGEGKGLCCPPPATYPHPWDPGHSPRPPGQAPGHGHCPEPLLSKGMEDTRASPLGVPSCRHSHHNRKPSSLSCDRSPSMSLVRAISRDLGRGSVGGTQVPPPTGIMQPGPSPSCQCESASGFVPHLVAPSE